jgi:hypothetical protein
MPRPRLDTPNYRLVRRGDVFYVRWWQDGAWQRISTGAQERRKAEVFLSQFAAGRGTPTPPEQPDIGQILAGYLADRQPVVRHFERLDMAALSPAAAPGRASAEPHHQGTDSFLPNAAEGGRAYRGAGRSEAA